MTRHLRQFASTPSAAVSASAFLEETVRAAGLSDSLLERVLMVAGEAVANAAGHGNGFDPTRRVTVTLSIDEALVTLRVEDEGAGIDSERLTEATLPDDPLQGHGRGLYIIRELAARSWMEGRRCLCAEWATERA